MEEPENISEASLPVGIPINTDVYESRSISPETIGSSILLHFTQHFENILDNEEGPKEDEVNVESLCAPGKQESSFYKDLYDLAKTDFEARMLDAEKTIQEKEAAIKKSQKTFFSQIDRAELEVQEYLQFFKQADDEHNKVKDHSRILLETKELMKNLKEQSYLSEFSRELQEKSIFKENYHYRLRVSPEVVRYGLCSTEFNHLCDVVTLDVLHPVEFYTLSNALNYLKNTTPADKDLRPPPDERGVRVWREKEYKENVVLCDIFARTGGVIRRCMGGNIPEVHTVVLWKITDEKVVLIDPTNASFSAIAARHLIGEDLTIVPVVDEFNSDSIPKQFYNKGGEKIIEGRKSIEPRDCIDIAVKVAFEIQELQMLSTDPSEIISEVYKEMANCDNIDAANSLKFLRGAHSSDATQRQLFSYMYHTLSSTEENPINPTTLKNVFSPKFSAAKPKGRAKK